MLNFAPANREQCSVGEKGTNTQQFKPHTIMEEKNLEWFLRRNFGVEEYYTEEYKEFIAQGGTCEEFVDKWFEDDYCVHMYTPEALDAWDRANDLVDDLVAMGLLDDAGPDSPADRIHEGFVDLS